MSFKCGDIYTRKEIHEIVGGSLQAFLPHKDGQVVCACLRNDLNPEAPEIVLVGKGPKVRDCGNALCKQSEPIPIFTKEDVNAWKYVGEYIVEDWSEDPTKIKSQKKRARRNDITRIIYLKKIRIT